MKRGASILIAAALVLALLGGLALTWPGMLSLAGSLTRPSPLQSPGAAEADPFRAAFAMAAFRAEYDDAGRDTLRRWAGPIIIWVDGERGADDDAALDAFIAQLNEKVAGLPRVSRAGSQGAANVTVRYARLQDLPALNPDYVAGNWGFFTFWYDDDWQIDEALVLIASDVTRPAERTHLLLEELTGALGLANDLPDQPESILYQSWTTTQQLSDLDWRLLNTLYDARLRPGMGFDEAKRALGWR